MSTVLQTLTVHIEKEENFAKNAVNFSEFHSVLIILSFYVTYIQILRRKCQKDN